MPVQSKLFTDTQKFYEELNEGLQSAEERISMMYFAFDHGRWAQKISNALCERAKAGVDVRLMVDLAGLISENPKNIVRNHLLMNRLEKSGVQVTKFQPNLKNLGLANRLHCKMTAIDEQQVFMGGSNIADHYLDWSDTNLKLQGDFGSTFHQIYDYVQSFHSKQGGNSRELLDPTQILTDDLRVWMTVPRQHTHVREAMLNLINNASSSLHIRTWYFLPDEEILEALCAQAKRGVQVNVLLSDKTRVRPVDAANFIHADRLAKAGGRTFRFTKGYMHSKAAWNNHDEVLLGSANMDACSHYQNFENVVSLKSAKLSKELNASFAADIRHAYLQTQDIFQKRSISKKMLSRTSNLASAWL